MAPALRLVALFSALTALTSGSAAGPQDLAHWRELTHHETSLADLEITHAAVELTPARPVEPEDAEPQPPRESSGARIVAELDLVHHGRDFNGQLQWLLTPIARMEELAIDGESTKFRVESRRVGEFSTLLVRTAAAVRLKADQPLRVRFVYHLREAAPGDSVHHLGARRGLLAPDAQWLPTLRSPLSETGPDRFPLEARLVGEGLTLLAPPAGAKPGPAWLVWGRFQRLQLESERGRAELFLHDPDDLPRRRSSDFVLAASLELRGFFEARWGAQPQETVRVVSVEGDGHSWGAPLTVLLDRSELPAGEDAYLNTYRVLARELARSWWGERLRPLGDRGYLQEGLVNYAATIAVGARFGRAAEELMAANLSMHYAAGGGSSRSLAELSLLDGAAYSNSHTHKAALLLLAIDGLRGRDEMTAVLRGLLDGAGEGPVGLDTLHEALAKDAHSLVEALWQSFVETTDVDDALVSSGKVLERDRSLVWQRREPDRVDAPMEGRAEVLLDHVSEIARASIEAGELDAAALAALSALRPATREQRFCVLDAGGTIQFDTEGRSGSVLELFDLAGAAIYAPLVSSEDPGGRRRAFDGMQPEAARQTTYLWRRVGRFVVVVEASLWVPFTPE